MPEPDAAPVDHPSDLAWTVGRVAITRVEENIVPLTAKVLLPDATVDQVEANRPWIDPYFDGEQDGHPVMRLSIHSFVLRTGDTTIVVDTCVGAGSDRGLPGDVGFADRLDQVIDGGLAAVDLVVCTHVHFDHVGWNTRTVEGRLVPTFPNARYLVTRAELDEVEADDHMGVREPSILPLFEAGVLDVVELDVVEPDVVESDGEESSAGRHRIADGVELLSTPGHTAGHVSVLIESEGERALITGDAFHSPLQVAHPEVAAWRFDTDSDRSTATRRRLLGRFVDTDTLVLGTHFAPPTGGRLVGDGGGRVRFEG